MNAMYRRIGGIVAIAVLVNRTAGGSAEPQPTEASGIVVQTESATGQPADNLTFTPVVQRRFASRPGTLRGGPRRRGITRRGARKSRPR